MLDDISKYNISQVRVPLSLGSEILIQISNLNLRVRSVLVGMEHEKFILAKIFPRDLVGNFRSESIKESPIEIMYLNEDTVYQFHTKILSAISEPERLYFFDYPKIIEERGLCNKTRHGCFVPAQTMLVNNIVEMVILDFSNEGCLCAIDTATDKGSKLYMEIQVDKRIEIIVNFPVTNESLKLPGIIRNISKEDDRIKVGILFDGADPAVMAKVADFVSIVQTVQVSTQKPVVSESP
ncbi:MAG: flagellar brake domain-containing protein [Proteobacteria bacterium]|nr:flagellar brake domain-containing protein [Pseudomonadota bacterium]